MTKNDRGERATIACPFCDRLNGVRLERAGDRPRCGACGRPLLLDRPLSVTEATLERVVKGTTVPVLVDFYADWCGPCKVMAPVLDEVAQEWTGRALVLKLDTDRNPGASARHGIRGIPTLVVFRDGVEAGRQVGAVPRATVEALLSSPG